MTTEVELIFSPDSVVGVYSDDINYRALAADLGGSVSIRRASHVEPTADSAWEADMSPVGGPVLGPFESRSEALSAEVSWLRTHLAGGNADDLDESYP